MSRRMCLMSIFTSLILALLVSLPGCGGGGGDRNGEDEPSPPGAYLLFYGDNTTPDTSGDGLFKIQSGALWPVKIINATGRSQVQDFTILGDRTVFTACDVRGCEPWISDGSSSGTTLIKDINRLGDSNPANYTLLDGALYFSANNGVNGVELWKTDGTEAGTVMVKNIGIEQDPNSLLPLTAISSNPAEFTVFNGALYFVANDIDYQGFGAGIELWRTDGTESGTVIVRNIALEDPDNPSGDPDIPVDSSPHELTVFNGSLYFAATDGPYGPNQYGLELWKTDGTDANTVIVKNIGVNPINAEASYDGSPQQFTVFDNALYFFADDGNRGFEPWKTTGNEVSTVILANIGIDSDGPFPRTTNTLTYWTEAGGALYLTANDGISGVEPWRTDGIVTTMLADINPSGSSVVPGRDDVYATLNDQLVFFANDGTHGFEPWISDGTTLGTFLIKDLYANPINLPLTTAGLQFLTRYQNRLYFTADNGLTGQEIWTTDGNSTETDLLLDIAPGPESGYRNVFRPKMLDGGLFFSASDGVFTGRGVEIWRTLGTASETQIVEDLNPGPPDGVLTATPLIVP